MLDVEELASVGVVITIEGAVGFPLKLESLEQRSTHKAGPRPKWLLLSVRPATDDTPELAQVWVSDEYRANFLALFEKFVTEDHATSGKPKNRGLVKRWGIDAPWIYFSRNEDSSTLETVLGGSFKKGHT